MDVGGGVALDEVVGGPGAGELHAAVFQLVGGGRVFVLVTLDGLVVNQVSDVEEELAGVHALAGDLLGDGKEHAMHLDGEGAGFRLTFALASGAVAQAGEILLADGGFAGCLVAAEVAGAGVVYEHFEVHFGFAAEALDVGEEVALVGADGAAEAVVIGEGGGEAEGQDGGELEAVGDDAGVVASGVLGVGGHAGGVFGGVLRDNDGEVAGGKEEGLIAEEAGDSGEGHWAAVAGKFRKGLSFGDAVGVPGHGVFRSEMTLVGAMPIMRSICVLTLCCLKGPRTTLARFLTGEAAPSARRIVCLWQDSWQWLLLGNVHKSCGSVFTGLLGLCGWTKADPGPGREGVGRHF